MLPGVNTLYSITKYLYCTFFISITHSVRGFPIFNLFMVLLCSNNAFFITESSVFNVTCIQSACCCLYHWCCWQLGCPRNSADTEFRGIFWLLKWFLRNSGEIPRNSTEFRRNCTRNHFRIPRNAKMSLPWTPYWQPCFCWLPYLWWIPYCFWHPYCCCRLCYFFVPVPYCWRPCCSFPISRLLLASLFLKVSLILLASLMLAASFLFAILLQDLTFILKK